MSISVEEMIQNAVHFGHRTNKWNPRMKPYIYGNVNGVHLFDLEKSKTHLEKLLDYVKKAVEEGKTILFVSTKPQTAITIPELAEIHGFPYVTQKWFGGLLTNFGTMKERIRYFKNLKEQQATGEFEKYPKKEQMKFEKEILKLEKALGGIQSMRRVPDVIFVVDGKRDLIAVNEAKKLRIPVIGICDSNADPDLYDLFVPANDDAIKSLDYILGLVAEVLKNTKPIPKAVPVAPVRQKPTFSKGPNDKVQGPKNEVPSAKGQGPKDLSTPVETKKEVAPKAEAAPEAPKADLSTPVEMKKEEAPKADASDEASTEAKAEEKAA
jgi:small subunit ribosomal protein S2